VYYKKELCIKLVIYQSYTKMHGEKYIKNEFNIGVHSVISYIIVVSFSISHEVSVLGDEIK